MQEKSLLSNSDAKFYLMDQSMESKKDEKIKKIVRKSTKNRKFSLIVIYLQI